MGKTIIKKEKKRKEQIKKSRSKVPKKFSIYEEIFSKVCSQLLLTAALVKSTGQLSYTQPTLQRSTAAAMAACCCDRGCCRASSDSTLLYTPCAQHSSVGRHHRLLQRSVTEQRYTGRKCLQDRHCGSNCRPNC
jgi:hypothetical protein